MHFHLPKPLHGWREFAGEVGIIVVGVLIALGAEQVVEGWSWRHRTDAAVANLRGELATDYKMAVEMAVTVPCVDRQLATLEDRVASSGATLQPSPNYSEAIYSRYTFRAPSREWPDEQWQAMVVEGVTPHLDVKTRRLVSLAHDYLANVRATNRLVDGTAYRLQLLARPVPLDASTRAHLIEEIEEGRGHFDDMKLRSNQVLGAITRAGYTPAPSEVDAYLRRSGTVAFCRVHHLPLGRPAPQS